MLVDQENLRRELRHADELVVDLAGAIHEYILKHAATATPADTKSEQNQ
jgi:hypothetical protein